MREKISELRNVNMQSIVSIIVPMFNCERFIKKCLQSLISQKYHNIEIIVVDDGSTDNGSFFAKEMAKIDKRISYYFQKNQGVAEARNFAVNQSKGKYLLFVDSDDYLREDYVETLVTIAETNHSELVVGGYTLEYADKKKKNQIIIPSKYIRLVSEEWVYRISSTCSHLYLKDFWKKNNIKYIQEAGARAEDVPIVLFANAVACNISIAQNSGYYYVQHINSAMNIPQSVRFKFPYQAFELYYKRVLSNNLQNSQKFFDMGVIKFLAYFEFIIYWKAEKSEKEKFKSYIVTVIGEDFLRIKNNWKELRKKIDLPIINKIAIEVFIKKYNGIIIE